MRIYKNKAFSKWAAREGVSNKALKSAVEEMERGLIDADLGGHVFKKRVAIGGRGKSGGVRTLLAYRVDNRAFFVYGFAKKARANIRDDELKGLRAYARELLGYNDNALSEAVKSGALVEVESNE